MRDIAIVSYAQAPVRDDVQDSETQMLFPIIQQAINDSGLDRKEIGFTCSGSCDYLAGSPFAFVSNLEATGAWPPISESHVEMDGAWSLYEAWVRLQHGDVDSALVFSSGTASRGNMREVLCMQLDPYYLAPLWPDHVSLAALQARALLDANGYTEKDFADVVARSRRDAKNNPDAQLSGDLDPEVLLKEPYLVAPLREHDVAPASDGAAAAILVAGDKAKELTENPAWIRGIDHRIEPHYPGVRNLATSPSTKKAGEEAGVGKGPIEVAELMATFSHEELILKDALGLGADTVINPSGGALTAHALMATGLMRIGEAFRQINQKGKSRVLAHASSGPCLQQNLVVVLEGGK
jgi:acetyl-CoA acetyltransferase